MKKILLLSLVLSFASCKPRSFNENSDSRIKAEPVSSGRTKKPCELVYKVEDKNLTPVKPSKAGTTWDQFVKTFIASADFKQSFPRLKAELSKLTEANVGQWMLNAVIPLSMTLCDFQEGGPLRWEAYVAPFMREVFDAESEDFWKTQTKTLEKTDMEWINNFYMIDKNFNSMFFTKKMNEFPDINFLRLKNAVFSDEKSRGQFRHQVVYDDLILTKDEADFIATGELKNVLSLEDGENAGEKGKQMHYLPVAQLYTIDGKKGALELWQEEMTAAMKKPEAEFINAVALLNRKCIAFHPFKDGNGRSCRVWSNHALATRNVPFPILWAGEDVLLSQQEWLKRWNMGIADHKALLAKLK